MAGAPNLGSWNDHWQRCMFLYLLLVLVPRRHLGSDKNWNRSLVTYETGKQGGFSMILKRAAEPSARNHVEPVELDLAQRKKTQNLPGDLLRNLPRNPLNLTWFCTMISWKMLPNLFRKLVEPDLALHRSLPDLLQSLLGNLVEPDLVLHQNLPDLLQDLVWNLLRSPVELNLAWHLPDLLQNLFRNPVELDLALYQSLPDLLIFVAAFFPNSWS